MHNNYTLTWPASEYNVLKLHQRYILEIMWRLSSASSLPWLTIASLQIPWHNLLRVQWCVTSAETAKVIKDREHRTSTSTFTQRLSSNIPVCWEDIIQWWHSVNILRRVCVWSQSRPPQGTAAFCVRHPERQFHVHDIQRIYNCLLSVW